MGVDTLTAPQDCGWGTYAEKSMPSYPVATDSGTTNGVPTSECDGITIESLQDELKACYARIAELEEAVNSAEARELQLLQSLTENEPIGGSFAGSPNKPTPPGPRKQLNYNNGSGQHNNRGRLGNRTKSTPVIYSPLNPTTRGGQPASQHNDIVVHIIREHCDAAYGFTLGGSDIGIGLRVAAVSEGGPADVAGLSVDDIVLSIDGVDFRRPDITTLEAATIIGESGTLLTVNLLDPEVRADPEKHAATLKALISGDGGSRFPMTTAHGGQQFPMKIKASFMGTTVQAPDLWTFFLGWRRWRRKQESRVTAQYHVTHEISDEDLESDSTHFPTSPSTHTNGEADAGSNENMSSLPYKEEEQCVIKQSLDPKYIRIGNSVVTRAPGKMRFGGFGSRRRKQASELQAVYQAAQSTLQAERTRIETSTSAFDFSDLSTMMGDATDDEDESGGARMFHSQQGSGGFADDDFDADATSLYQDNDPAPRTGSPARRVPSDNDFSALYNDCLYGDDTAVAWAEFKAIFGADDAEDIGDVATPTALLPTAPRAPSRAAAAGTAPEEHVGHGPNNDGTGEDSDFVITAMPPVSRTSSARTEDANTDVADGRGACGASNGPPASDNMRGIVDIAAAPGGGDDASREGADSEQKAQHAAARKRVTLSRASGKGVIARSVAAARRQGGTLVGALPTGTTEDTGRSISNSSTSSADSNNAPAHHDAASPSPPALPRDRRVQLSAKGLFAQKLAHVRAAGQQGSDAASS